MKILGYKLSTWIRHPIMIFESYKAQKYPVIDLDNPKNNCKQCGHAHKYAKDRVSCKCCKENL